MKINSDPQRIISLAPSVTETLFALGLSDRIVGVTSYCDYPAGGRSKRARRRHDAPEPGKDHRAQTRSGHRFGHQASWSSSSGDWMSLASRFMSATLACLTMCFRQSRESDEIAGAKQRRVRTISKAAASASRGNRAKESATLGKRECFSSLGTEPLITVAKNERSYQT